MTHLADFMAARGLDDETMAKRVKTPKIFCDRSMVSKHRRRLSRPDWPLIARYKKVTGNQVTADSFLHLRSKR